MSAMQLVEDGLMGLDAARAWLGGISNTGIYRLMDTGELPFTYVGGKRAIPINALKEYAAKGLKGKVTKSRR